MLEVACGIMMCNEQAKRLESKGWQQNEDCVQSVRSEGVVLVDLSPQVEGASHDR